MPCSVVHTRSEAEEGSSPGPVTNFQLVSVSLTRKRDVAQAEMAKKNKHNAITETESTHVFALEMD